VIAARAYAGEARAANPPPGFHDAGHGYDLFGLRPATLARAVAVARPLYQHYFRVESRGVERIPASGPVIVVANHSGALPVDGAMLCLDLLLRSSPTRIPRAVADRFVPLLPLVGTILTRLGVVAGSRANARCLLERGELLVVFPEGVAGVAKPFRDRYRLQDWSVGHAELALRHRAAVVPAAIIGAEESWPVALRLRGARLFGAPYLPVPASPLPLPVRYHIHYGEPIRFDHLPVEAADDPGIVAECAARVRDELEELIERGLTARRGLFR
jgi:1-acyl-sn-glycerol-3-phosphate acyltransferase